MHLNPRRHNPWTPISYFSIALFLCAALFAASAALAQAATLPPAETVHFPSQGESVRGILYKPAGAGPFPAIVVIHEWWGLTDWVQQQAADLAQQGYITLAVDLYRGQSATDPEMAHELMRGLPQDRGVGYLTSAVAYLKTRKDVLPHRIGAVGWCMGGGFALQLAIAEPTLRAVAINYGALDANPAQLKKIHAQVLGNFGAQDRGITPEDVQTFAKEMAALGHPVNVKEYADAGHAFQNPNNKAGYRPDDTADADRRMRTFFAENLKK